MLELAPPRIFTAAELSNEDYHASPGLSASQLKNLSSDLTPLDFWRESTLCPNRSFGASGSTALKFGQAAHMLILEGEDAFNKAWEVKMGVKETKVPGMLAEGEYNMLLRIRDLLMGHPLYSRMITGCTSETSIFTQRRVLIDHQAPTDQMCEIIDARTRIDMLRPGLALDLKFMSEVTKRSVGYAITDYGYDRQADWNLGVLNEAFPDVKHTNFITIFVEKHEFYPKVLAVTFPDALLTHVHRRNEAAVERYAKFKRKYGTDPLKPWPGFDHKIYNITENGTGGLDSIELPNSWNFIE